MASPLEIALGQALIGVQEEPRNSNWGPQVKQYLRAGGILSPAPWCCAFVVWCFRQAGIGSKTLPTTASCSFLLGWARENGKIVKDPQPGDIFLLLRKGGNSAFHTGLVRNVSKLYFGTVEGNSNASGSSEGYAVVQRTRSRILNRVAFVRIND